MKISPNFKTEFGSMLSVDPPLVLCSSVSVSFQLALRGAKILVPINLCRMLKRRLLKVEVFILQHKFYSKIILF